MVYSHNLGDKWRMIVTHVHMIKLKSITGMLMSNNDASLLTNYIRWGIILTFSYQVELSTVMENKVASITWRGWLWIKIEIDVACQVDRKLCM